MKISSGVIGVISRSAIGVAALAVAGSTLTACGGSDSKISVDKLQKIADKARDEPKSQCPLGFDVDAALKRAGVAGTATPGNPKDPDQPLVDADSATDAGMEQDAPLKSADGAMVTCEYTLSGGGYLSVTLTGVRTGRSIYLMAPMLQRDGVLSTDQLTAYITGKFDNGKAVLTPDRASAAVAVLAASGGDVALEVATEPEPSSAGGAEGAAPISGEPLRQLTEALVKQVRV